MTVVMEDLPETRFPDEPDNIREYLIPPPTRVPVVVGLSEGKAGKLLRIEARLNVTVVRVASLEPVGIVVNQSPAPGSTVPQGTFVTIFVSTGEIPVAPLPNLIGLTIDEALEVVRDFELNTGVKLSLFQEKVDVNDPNQVDRIVSTNPAPGTEITESASIVLFVGKLGPKDDG